MLACSLVAVACLLQAPVRPDPDKDDLLRKPTIGVEVADHEKIVPILQQNGVTVSKRKGVYVASVRPFSPVENDVKYLDLITSINGKEVDTADDFHAVLDAMKVPSDPFFMLVKPYQMGPKGAVWGASKKVKASAVETGRLARRSVVIERDPITGIGKVSVKPHKNVASSSPFSLFFIVDKEGYAVSPHLHFFYTGSDWVFTSKVTVKAGDETFVFQVDPNKLIKDVGKNGTVFENVAVQATDAEFKAIVSTIYAHEPLIRFTGDATSADVVMRKDQQWRLDLLLDAYDSLRYGDVFKYGDK